MEPVTLDVWWYYMLELGFYFSLSVTLMFDVKRKDFLAQMTHHVVTISLLMGSWINGATRVGSLILLVHDCADVFLECGKLMKYFHISEKIIHTVFVMFLVTWVLTRIIYFPLYIIIPITQGLLDWDRERHGSCFASNVIVILLWSLFGLHLYWTVLILQIVYKSAILKVCFSTCLIEFRYVFTDKEVNDCRSEDEDSDDDNEVRYKKSK
ncbi:unnamed protein product [Darwinula stevensoni]|uniref:TLC domain-containing protein n=1 Tax=Darwinula stevensoni TaxID=69355 RepID=A0A7R9AA37_9CRUS|nr:unnamed protein product [Darwinula stevensoni]CAG0897806.1 unnamed protein product [Darwinula stevensoni]